MDKVRVRQNICGALFGGLYGLNIIFALMKNYDLMPVTSTWHFYVLGFLGVCGYSLLSSISSNAASEVFCNSQICLVVVLTAMLPELATDQYATPLYLRIMLIVCIVLAITSIYLWTMLMANCSFDPRTMRWLIFLPMPYLANIAENYSRLEHMAGSNNMLVSWTVDTGVFKIFSCIILAMCAVGFWKLCHSRCFSHDVTDYSKVSWLPFNRFTLSYTAALVVVYLLF